ncbi:MAG TPA: TIGR03663 family protein [Candidatus Hydrogenedentes bacterium]|nr:TIGR03663 family protein [Candidatus Hydrogenedentota bacterium]
MVLDKRLIVYAILFMVICCIAASLRLPQLELRPVHGDEANQIVKTGILFEAGEYKYDPHEHHGPTLYYLALPVLWCSGKASFAETSIIHYRIVPVIFGVLAIALLWFMRDALGSGGMLWAALLLAVSHIMTYYSRYYIQEMLLVCFTQAVFAAAWRLWRAPRIGAAVLLGVSLGLVHATKETSALIAISIAGAAVLTMGYTRVREGETPAGMMRSLRVANAPKYAAVVCAVALLISVTLFSSFFSNLRGVLDSLLTYAYYLDRAEGGGSAAMHDKPWYYYIVLLAYTHRQAGPRWSEALTLLLALVGAAAALLPGASGQKADTLWRALLFRRFLVFYALLVWLLYSLIPYKTPWNALVPYHAAALAAGIGANAIIRVGRWRALQAALCMLFLAGVTQMARQNYQGNYVYPADVRNPYVYAHPSTALRRLMTRINDIAAISDKAADIHINIIRLDGDYWPLPWYLRGFTTVGWWHRIPDRPDADIILAAPELYEILQERLKNDYLVEFHALRPDMPLHTYIRRDLWDAFMETRQAHIPARSGG